MAQGFDFLAFGVDLLVVVFFFLSFKCFAFDGLGLLGGFFIGVGVVFVDDDLFFLACLFVGVIRAHGLIAIAA